jgi:cellobiose phosphorylase
MAVMFGNALYSRGFSEAGWKVIGSLYRHATDFDSSKIFPGVPEYFDPKGRGVYHYLTGAASWLMLTVLTEMYGVKGDFGGMRFEPQILPGQFDSDNTVGVTFEFNGKPVDLTYIRTGEGNKVAKIVVDGITVSENKDTVAAEQLGNKIEVYLA